MKKSGSGSVVVIFYAGHGIQAEGRNYWIPVDAGVSGDQDRLADIVNQLIPLDTLYDKETGDKSLMIIFNDTVRTNPFSKQVR